MTMDPSWNRVLNTLQPMVGEDAIERWFSGIHTELLPPLDEGSKSPPIPRIQLEVHNAIHQFWIESNYRSQLQKAVLEIYDEPLQICFLITAEADESEESAPAGGSDSEGEEKNGGTASDDSTPATGDLPDLAVAAKGPRPVRSDQKENRALFPEEDRRAVGDREGGGRSRMTDRERRAVSAGLNPSYSFSSYVIGGNCQFAAAASGAVAEKPGRVYNPLFIYGRTGLGKTHLMHAIGQQFLDQQVALGRKIRPGQVVYITSEEFTNEFVGAIAKGSMAKFRKKFRKADLLLIDDIQFLVGKDSTQEEFFHTFNALFDARKQIVLSSDRPPSEISEVEARLVSRFEWGLTTELLAPSLETRTAILRRKAEDWKVKLPAEVIDYLASRIRSNIRRLEGALIRVASFAALGEEKLDKERIDALLKDFLREEVPRAVKIEKIQKLVAEAFGIEFADMMSKARPQRIAFPRQVAMFLARKLSGASLKEIGRAFGGRDHGTVIHAVKLVTGRMEDDEDLRLQVEEFLARLESA